MKLKIYKKLKAPKAEEKVVRLKLIEYCGNIDLAVVDKTGETVSCGHILGISLDGTVKIYSGLDNSLGMPMENNHAKFEVE